MSSWKNKGSPLQFHPFNRKRNRVNYLADFLSRVFEEKSHIIIILWKITFIIVFCKFEVLRNFVLFRHWLPHSRHFNVTKTWDEYFVYKTACNTSNNISPNHMYLDLCVSCIVPSRWWSILLFQQRIGETHPTMSKTSQNVITRPNWTQKR